MERLIRFRGLTKPIISRRSRLLHNVYAWMRIVSQNTNALHESIHIVRAPEPASIEALSNVDAAVSNRRRANERPANTDDARLDYFLQFKPHQARSGPKSSAEDIHMESSHRDTDDMHMQIYGVPETWLRLVPPLPIEKNLSPIEKNSDAEILVSLQPKASYLEDAVCVFRSRHSTRDTGAKDTPHTHIVRALSSALVIFFYRIRNANPLILQDSVNSVIATLLAFDKALDQHGLLGPGTAWPAFIAGAEALESEQLQQIVAWETAPRANPGGKGTACPGAC
ncbi:hypothetical protein TOPH_07141 [Tolypocladium ophioglossoides CBS 100239]|uniref:Uncharacterized protein n=1 Tax=Tolypocladium ophioglossoides (strain CBS 100239) TaxID=1163406 RepID=A0A0L0N2I4_TOLOC|nr:hypothetical protein TOPH_07141 [Tolypocladium ophioglossoides CBS 100239]